MQQISSGALPLLMSGYANNFGINLYMFGELAFTDGNSVVIPCLDLKNQVAMEMAYGYVAHECGHIKHSNFKVMDTNEEFKSELFKFMFNSLEDCRIEYAQVCNWPGLQKTFDFLVEAQTSDLEKFIQLAKNEKSLTKLVAMYAMFYIRQYQNGNKGIFNVYIELHKLLKNRFPVSFIEGVNEIIQNVVKLENSQQVVDVTKNLFNFVRGSFKALTRASQKYLSDRERSKWEKKNFGDEDYSIEMQDPMEYDDVSLKEMERNRILSDDLMDNLKDEISQRNYKKTDVYNFEDDAKFNIESIADKLVNLSAQSTGEKFEYGRIRVGNAKVELGKKSLSYVDDSSSSTLRSKISNLLKSYETHQVASKNGAKRLDIRKYIVRKFLSVVNIFKDERIRDARKTSMHLLVDNSGSMLRYSSIGNTQGYKVANYVSYAMGCALNDLKTVKCDVSYFPGTQSEVDIVATHNDDIRSKALYFEQNPRGSTPLAQALMHSVNSFNLGDMNERKIIFVITDGEPNDEKYARDMVLEAYNNNIEVYAIYINHEDFKNKLFDNVELVKDIDSLPNTVCSLLDQAMYQ